MTPRDGPEVPSDFPRVAPPSGDDEQARREYGRQLAVDALLEQLLRPAGTETEPRTRSAGEAVPRRGRRFLIAGLALGTAAAAAVAAFLLRPPVAPTDPPPGGEIVVVPTIPPPPGWDIRPTGEAEFRIEPDGRVRLQRGELRIASVPLPDPAAVRVALSIETPEAVATASGTEFLIGTHSTDMTMPAKGRTMTHRLTRVLVLAGAVSLANSLGTVTGGPGRLLAAEPERPPVEVAVKANSAFAVDLYRQLAKQNPGRNVFLSPYSVSTALAMVTEGARGQTAEELGKALRFPEAARRIGADAQLIPWNTSIIHTGMAGLHGRFNGEDRPVPTEVRDRIAKLRAEFASAQGKVEPLLKAGKYREYYAASDVANRLAAELNKLLATVDQYELRVANRLWGERTFAFERPFTDTLDAHYRTGAVAPADFRGDPEGARKAINTWAEEQTKGRIKDILPPRSVTSDTRLVLANAVYFLGQWAEPFDPKLTKDAPFAAVDGSEAKVPTMRGHLKGARYAAFNGDGSVFDTPMTVARGGGSRSSPYPGPDGFLAAELPYKGGDLSMMLLVPQSRDGLERLEGQLSEANLSAWTAALKTRETEVALPRFRVETGYELKQALKDMGVNRAFDAASADFSGIHSGPTAQDRLFIGLVLHKAFVAVDEKGTEAAAVTAVVKDLGGPPHVPFVPVVRADRPFLFLVRDAKTGTVLFLGRVTDPSRN
jgi:serine protease inhibitor